MKEKGFTLPLGFALVFAVLTVVRGPQATFLGGTSEKGAATVENGDVGRGAEKKGEAEEPMVALHHPLRLYREFFGLPELQKTSEGDLVKRLGEVRDAAGGEGYDLEFLVALVPDPLDSELAANYDKAFEAIDHGFAQAWQTRVLAWRPWDSGDAKEKGAESRSRAAAYRSSPGLLLYRKNREQGGRPLAKPTLTGVLLVGESPKSGVERAAFAQAMSLILMLQQPPQQRIRILGPSFSGSAVSLRAALRAFRKENDPSALRPIEIVTGSATADDLEAVLTRSPQSAPSDPLSTNITFHRTVVTDSQMQRSIDRYARERGWNRRGALLVEADTVYGQNYRQSVPTLGQGASDGSWLAAAVRIPFPIHLSAIRTARESGGKGAESDSSFGYRVGKTDLGMSLAIRGRPRDVLAQASPLSTPTDDLATSNLIEQTVAREGVQYVGIFATDVEDKIFLAERLEKVAPDVIKFTVDGDLAFAHPQRQAAMNGMLVFSSYPLFPEGGAWLHGGDLLAGGRAQFTSEFEQGVFHAVLELLGEGAGFTTRQASTVWVSVVSNGALWPLESDRMDEPTAIDAGPKAASESAAKEKDAFSSLAHLQLSFFAVALCTLAWSLRRVARFPEETLEPSEGRRRFDFDGVWLLKLGLLLVCGAGAGLLILDSLPHWWSSRLPGWDEPIFPEPQNGPWTNGQCVYFAGIAVAYLFLILSLASPARGRAATGKQRSAYDPHWMWRELVPRTPVAFGWLAVGLALPVLLARSLQAVVPSEIEYFYLRARSFGSGLSPVVSLGWLTAGLFLWTVCELKRRRLTAWQGIDWPVDTIGEPALQGTQEVVEELKGLLGRTLPTPWFWLLLLVALVLPVHFLLKSFRPIAETRAYGQSFILLLVLVVVLSTISVGRFFAVWRRIRRVLVHVEHTPLAHDFGRLSKEVEWDPMKSFGWQLPPFKALTLSAEKLKAVGRSSLHRSLLAGHEITAAKLDELVGETFAASVRGDLDREVARRRELGELFATASDQLAAERKDVPAVADFFAVRAVAYLRYVFAHLRNSLIGALFAPLCVLFAVTSYAFEPKSLLSLVLWSALMAAVGLTLWTFVEMDRNVALSLIGGHSPGEVTFNTTFFSNLFTYVLLPLLALIATQAPSAGQLLSALKPMLRVVGAG